MGGQSRFFEVFPTIKKGTREHGGARIAFFFYGVSLTHVRSTLVNLPVYFPTRRIKLSTTDFDQIPLARHIFRRSTSLSDLARKKKSGSAND